MNREERTTLVRSVIESINVYYNKGNHRHRLKIVIKEDLATKFATVTDDLLLAIQQELDAFFVRVRDWCYRSSDTSVETADIDDRSTTNSIALFGYGGVINNKWQLLTSGSATAESLMLVSPWLTLTKRPLSQYQLYLRKQVFRLHAAGWNDPQIARHFNEQGIMTVRGKEFKANHVWSIRKKM